LILKRGEGGFWPLAAFFSSLKPGVDKDLILTIRGKSPKRPQKLRFKLISIYNWGVVDLSTSPKGEEFYGTQPSLKETWIFK
jgi:hypothetical protein